MIKLVANLQCSDLFTAPESLHCNLQNLWQILNYELKRVKQAKMSVKHVKLEGKKMNNVYAGPLGRPRRPTHPKNLLIWSEDRVLPLLVQTSSALTHS